MMMLGMFDSIYNSGEEKSEGKMEHVDSTLPFLQR